MIPSEKTLFPEPEKIIEQWSSIQEKYFETTNKEYLPKFILERKFNIDEDLDMIMYQALFALLDLGDERAEVKLKELGFYGEYEDMQNQYLQKQTVYNRHKLERQQKSNKVVQDDYYVMLASVRKRGFNVQSDMLLVEWCGILNEIKQENERKGQNSN